MFTAEAVHKFSPQILKDIIYVNKHSFPDGWQCDGAETYYGGMLRKKQNIHIVLKEDAKIIGYLLAIPHNDAVDEIKYNDPEMEEDGDRYYIETVEILPGYAGKGGFTIMLDKLLEESKLQGIKLSMHARVTNQFSDKVRNKLTVSKVRRIERWKYYNFEEPTDYIEGTYGNIK